MSEPPGRGAGLSGAPPTLLYSGKVRDVYSWGDDLLLLVASDRVSAYDHVLPTPIPDKGKILTQLSLWWFGQLADLVPNHLVNAEIPAGFAGRAMACRRLSMVPVECVARGYLAGSGLREYRQHGSVCGVPLPPGLTDGSRLPEPIFTPATKAPRGQHDENIPMSAVAESVGAGRGRRAGADHAGGVPAGRGHRRQERHPGGRHQDRARLRSGWPAAAGRRGSHPRLVPAVACEPVAARQATSLI